MGFDEPDCLARYDRLRANRPELFANPAPGTGYRILFRPEEIAAARAAVRDRRGAEDLRVGVLATDPFVTLLREAVEFPDGSLGLYNRVLVPPGVVIVPTLPDGRMLLIERARHGIRARSLEFPRGLVDPGETLEDAARREAHEEIGAPATAIERLGAVHPSNGCIAEFDAIFRVHVTGSGSGDPAEGIAAIVAVSPGEFARLVANGAITDGCTLAAYAQMHAAAATGGSTLSP